MLILISRCRIEERCANHQKCVAPLVISCNAAQMKRGIVMKMYGDVKIPSIYCYRCRQNTFVIDGEKVCCGRPTRAKQPTDFKVQTDKVGVKRKLPPKKDRDRILKEQDYRCLYCGAHFGYYRATSGGPELIKLNWDHQIPFTWDSNNNSHVAACSRCNQVKGNLHFSSLEEAKAYIQERVSGREIS